MAEKTRFAPTLIRRWWIGLALTSLVTVLCLAYVDRPLALWAHDRIRSPWFYDAARDFYILLLVAGAGVGLIAAASIARRLTGRAVERSTVVLASWAAAGGLVSSILFKYLFGRTPPYPDYVEQHHHAFRPIVGGEGNFPSTTTTVVAAMAMVIAMRSPRWGSIAIVSAALIALSLPLVNAHWLSDVVAGGFLGAVVGKGTLSFADRLPSNTTLND